MRESHESGLFCLYLTVIIIALFGICLLASLNCTIKVIQPPAATVTDTLYVAPYHAYDFAQSHTYPFYWKVGMGLGYRCTINGIPNGTAGIWRNDGKDRLS